MAIEVQVQDPNAAAAQAAGLAYATSQMKSGKLTVFDTELSNLYLQSTPHPAVDTSAFAALATSMPGSVQTVAGQTYVTVDIVARGGDGAALLPLLQDVGLQDASSFKGMVSGQIATSDLEGLRAALAGPADGKGDDIGFASISASMTSTGSVTTQADQAENADLARSHSGDTGSGIKVGILSDSFNTDVSASTHMARDIATGDLPTATTILQDSIGGTDEGRAMAQLVHDIAPGASIEFATGEGGQAAMANNILALAAAGAKVIVDDLIYFGELYYQEGPIAQAIDQVAAEGVSYFSAAGNDGDGTKPTGFETAWQTGAVYAGGGETSTLLRFPGVGDLLPPGQDFIPVTLTGHEYLVLQWDNPGASAGGAGANADLDLFLTNQSGSTVYAESASNNIGGDPVEVIGPTGLAAGTYYLRVGLFAGPAPDTVKLMTLANGGDSYFGVAGHPLPDLPGDGQAGAFYGHAAAEGAIGVGAADWSTTPRFDPGGSAARESFSSAGDDEILFDNNGARLATPEYRTPSITGADGGDTTFFGSDTDGDGHPNFYGTSAAAPDTAAVAALMLQARPGLTPTDIKNLMMDAVQQQVGGALADPRFGAGLIDADTAVGFAGSLTIANGLAPQNAALVGTGFADVIRTTYSQSASGLAGDDMLYGSGGNALYGGSGDDTLFVGGSNDRLDGGAGGHDVASYAFSGAVTVNLSMQGVAQGTGGAGFNTLVSIEGVIGSSFGDVLTAATTGSMLSGAAGDDTLIGGAGDDVLNGGDGMDAASYAMAAAGVNVSLATTAAQSTGGAGTDTLVGIESLIGSAFNDVLTAAAAGSSLNGGAGNDTLVGGAGNDLLDGGVLGEDAASFAAATAGVSVSLGLQGAAQNTGGAGDDTLLNIHDLIGSNFADALTGDANDNQLLGGAGDDVLEGGAGNDVLVGGAGTDTASYAHAASGVSVSLGVQNTYQNTIGAGSDYLSGVEALIGSGFDDTLAAAATGSSLSGAAGDDTLIGGAGNDLLDGGPGVDTVSYATAASGVQVSLAVSGPQTTGAGGGVDTLVSIEHLIGSSFNDTLAAGSASANLDGGAGNDRLVGGPGDDTLNGGVSGDDTASFAAAAGGVTVSLGLQGAPQITGGAGEDTLLNIHDLIGSNFADALTGDANDNQLLGGAGDDVLEGGAGSDVLIGGRGIDTASYLHAVSAVTVSLTLQNDYQNTGGEGSDDLSGIESLVGSNFDDVLSGDANFNSIQGRAGSDLLTGLAGDDSLYGGGGPDTLDGGLGADALYGGSGNDVYVVDNPGDQAIESPDDGVDTVNASVSFTLGANVENLTLTGAAAINGSGNELDNKLTGNAAANVLSGGAGDDTLIGLDGDDTLAGGPGADKLTGGNGADTFVFGPASTAGADRINDFTHGVDHIAVHAGDYGGLPVGALNPGDLVFGTAAVDAHAEFIFDAAHKTLLWDADGVGGAPAVAVATFPAAITLTAGDFLILA